MSPDPTRPVKKATKATTRATADAAHTGASAAKPSRLTKGLAKLLPLSLRTKIRLLLARLWAKLKTWRLRRRARNV
jgi:hypothetical protein